MNYAVLYWPTMFSTDIGCTLRSYGSPCWAALHPTELRWHLLSFPPSELHRVYTHHNWVAVFTLQFPVNLISEWKIMPTPEPGWSWNKGTHFWTGGAGLRLEMPECLCRRHQPWGTGTEGGEGGRVGRGFHLPLISLSEGVQSGLSLTSGSCFAPQKKKKNLGINL